MSYKIYTVTVEVEVNVRDKALVAQNPESVAAAMRHYLRSIIPVGWRKNGVGIVLSTIHAEAKEKETVE